MEMTEALLYAFSEFAMVDDKEVGEIQNEHNIECPQVHQSVQAQMSLVNY